MIKAVIFDMGGVLIGNGIEKFYEKLAEKLGIDTDFFILFEKRYHEKMIRGELEAKGFIDMIKKEFNPEGDVLREWKEVYREARPVNGDLIQLIKRLKKGYSVSLISDSSDLNHDINNERGLYSYFESPVVSCDTGVTKSQREIFEIALEKLDLKPEECILIDDREEHLEIPKGMGFRTILFRNNRQLAEDLEKLGVQI